MFHCVGCCYGGRGSCGVESLVMEGGKGVVVCRGMVVGRVEGI